MKKLILFILFIIGFSHIIKAQSDSFMDDEGQYAVIKDTDGYVNIRRSPSIDASLIGKINRYNIFRCETNNTNWWKILYIANDNDGSHALEGYIYKDRVSLLTNWKTIKRHSTNSNISAFKTDSLIITIKKADFDPKKHKLFYSKSNPKENIGKYLQKIDGKSFWGADGDLPKKLISYLKVIKNGFEISIPKNCFSDLYEPNFQTLSIFKGPENILYIKMDNSDGAGAYTIIWIFKDNKYYGRSIDTAFA
jgi:hypothetical protein